MDDYPRDHLDAMSNPKERSFLLEGAHSLWYVLATWRLHDALADLDKALAAVPPPVRTAVEAELATEANWLQVALAEAEGEETSDTEGRRLWEHGDPFIYAEDLGLSERDREHLEEHDDYDTDADRQLAADDLRMMLDAYTRCSPDALTSFSLEGLDFFIDPFDSESGDHDFYLEVGPRMSENLFGAPGWGISIGRWEVDEVDDDGEAIGATGSTFLDATFAERPGTADLTALLEVSHSQIATWATADIGDTLDGTKLVVAQRMR
ncbi:hypothetical protein ACFVJS_00760 [Nocardioides sp. NPDC057772]|uniref:hypothetical protein n=1 Tax=Nocardioides sp. NPDC057772 TaxID=3346245 RepID=UPI00367354AA